MWSLLWESGTEGEDRRRDHIRRRALHFHSRRREEECARVGMGMGMGRVGRIREGRVDGEGVVGGVRGVAEGEEELFDALHQFWFWGRVVWCGRGAGGAGGGEDMDDVCFGLLGRGWGWLGGGWQCR